MRPKTGWSLGAMRTTAIRQSSVALFCSVHSQYGKPKASMAALLRIVIEAEATLYALTHPRVVAWGQRMRMGAAAAKVTNAKSN